jgi:hypothetical protein
MAHGHAASEEVVYGMVAEFETADQLLAAANAAKNHGFSNLEAYTPFPVHGLSEAIGFRDQRVPWFIFAGGMMGGLLGYTMQWWISVIDYPLNVGGKPLNSLPAFFPVTFECTILAAALTAVGSVIVLNRLPRPYHSIFNTPGFERASQDRFFLEVSALDSKYDVQTTRDFLESLNPIAVNEVML